MRYIICESDDVFSLQCEVNAYIKSGYMPIGGLVIRNIVGAVLYLQAMTLTPPSEPVTVTG